MKKLLTGVLLTLSLGLAIAGCSDEDDKIIVLGGGGGVGNTGPSNNAPSVEDIIGTQAANQVDPTLLQNADEALKRGDEDEPLEGF